jgi:hypothetical protein
MTTAGVRWSVPLPSAFTAFRCPFSVKEESNKWRADAVAVRAFSPVLYCLLWLKIPTRKHWRHWA